MLAGIILNEWPNTDHFVPLNLIFTSRKAKSHIKPVNSDDFDKSFDYRVKWCVCEDKGIVCDSEDNCQQENPKFYKGKIFALGGKYNKSSYLQLIFN